MYRRCIPCIPIQSSILRYFDICVSVAETRLGCAPGKNSNFFPFSYVSVLEPGQVLHDPPGNPKFTQFPWVGFMRPIRYCKWTILYSRVLFCNLPINLELFPKATHLLFLYGFQHIHALFLYTIYSLCLILFELRMLYVIYFCLWLELWIILKFIYDI